MKFVLAILLPPIAVLRSGAGFLQFLINCILCFCLWLPGVIHALYIAGVADQRGLMRALTVNGKVIPWKDLTLGWKLRVVFQGGFLLFFQLPLVAGLSYGTFLYCRHVYREIAHDSERNRQLASNSVPLISGIDVQRTQEGGVTVSGSSILPRETGLRVEIRAVGDGRLVGKVNVSVGVDAFQSEPLLSEGSQLIAEGDYKIIVSARFTEKSQPGSVLAITGDNGVNLPKKYTISDDPEFPDGARHLAYTEVIHVPRVLRATEIIAALKKAHPTTPEHGRSPASVAEAVRYYSDWHRNDGDRIDPQGWSAAKTDAYRWRVSLTLKEGFDTPTAEWEFDESNGTVKYLDPKSKHLSWAPVDK